MEQIDIVREWKDKARVEGRREAERDKLLKVLRKRFPPEVPPDLAQAVQQTTDLDQLARWFDAALDAPSLDVFRAVVQPCSGNSP